MKNGTLIACAMARRTRMSDSSLRRKLNSMVLVRALPSFPLVVTMKRLSLPSRAMSEIVSPENGLYCSSPASICAAAAARSVITFQTMRSR